MQLFVVGKYVLGTELGSVWELQGVFDSSELAEKACLTNQYFVGPAGINIPFPEESTDWPGLYYPNED